MSNAVDDILNSLDMAQLADMVGASQSEVEQATAAALPALFGGLDANAQDPAGAGSILEALGQHDGELLDGGVDLGQVDAQDGEAITRHIFGSNEDAVYSQLGGYGAAGGLGGSLFRKLLPILAPIVLSYIMKQMTQRTGGSSSGSGGGGLGDILGQVLGGGSAAQPQDSQPQDAQVDDNVLPQRTDPTSSAPVDVRAAGPERHPQGRPRRRRLQPDQPPAAAPLRWRQRHRHPRLDPRRRPPLIPPRQR
jgi:hypothetical protein